MHSNDVREYCRLCQGKLKLVIDLGKQCLSGQFPKKFAKNPLKYPLRFMKCNDCGLAQLDTTVPADEMFSEYWYRSSITNTMRNHLEEIAREAKYLYREANANNPLNILDIGCNDGTLLSYFSEYYPVGIDLFEGEIVGGDKINGLYPNDMIRNDIQFDIIFSIAMFYDIDNPVEFMRNIKMDLADNGIWCVEVAYLPSVLYNVCYDGICHEHLTYWDIKTLQKCAKKVGLSLINAGKFNDCNGGSFRCYFTHEESKIYSLWNDHALFVEYGSGSFTHFVEKIQENKDELLETLNNYENIHLLGASTKANVLLQYCDIGDLISYASERDSKKHGRKTPGTNIPIISEKESRDMKPDAYLVGPWHFRDEIIKRELVYIKSGGTLIFPLPKVEIYNNKRLELAECH